MHFSKFIKKTLKRKGQQHFFAKNLYFFIFFNLKKKHFFLKKNNFIQPQLTWIAVPIRIPLFEFHYLNFILFIL